MSIFRSKINLRSWLERMVQGSLPDCLLGAFKRLLQCPPREHGAFDALRKLLNPFEQDQFAQRILIGGLAVSHNHPAKILTHGGCLLFGFSFDFLRHHRRAGLTDGAPLAGEFEVFDNAAAS